MADNTDQMYTGKGAYTFYVCKGSESPPTFIGRRKREIYQPEVTCCNTDLCNHGNNTIGSTQASTIELTTPTGCHDDKSCQTLKTLGVQVCSYHDVAVRLCPAMCNRCYDVTSSTVIPVSRSVTAALDMTSPYNCRDKSNECNYLKNSLHICDYYDVVVHFGCMNTCGLCSVATNPGIYTDSPTPGTITALHTIHVTMTSEKNRPRTFSPQNTEQVIVTSETTPVQYTTPADSQKTAPVQYTTQGNSQKTAPVQHTTPADSQKTAPVQYTNQGNSQKTAPVQYTTQGNSQKTAPVQYTTQGNSQKTAPVQYTTQGNSQKTAPVQYTTQANSQKTAPVQYTTQANSQENLSTNTDGEEFCLMSVTTNTIGEEVSSDVTDGEEFVLMSVTNN
ncbi:uncharacterized protein [Argopecten irradians]|uniref:uncharacterized protein n=1 Tax=Argopecten irradians TaxID=31199 RepID=UPI003716835E